MHDGAAIRLLLCAAIALGWYCATSARAVADETLQPRPAKADADNTLAPSPGKTGAPGSVRLEGDAAAVRLQVRQTSVASVLAALAAAYRLSYRSAVKLDALCDGIYAGSLASVIARLLDGYDYLIEVNGAALGVFILGKSGQQAVLGPMMTPIRQHRIPVTYRISPIRP